MADNLATITLETMAQKIRDGIPDVDVTVNDPGDGGIPSIMVLTERGSMSIFHVPVAHCTFPLAVKLVSTPGIDPGALGEIYDGGAPFVPDESFLIDLKSPGGEITGLINLPGWMRRFVRRGRAKRYSRSPAWRFRARINRLVI